MKFIIENVIEADSLNDALRIAHENIYFAEVDVEEIKVRPVSSGSQERMFRTFGEIPTETDPKQYEKIVGNTEPFIPFTASVKSRWPIAIDEKDD